MLLFAKRGLLALSSGVKRTHYSLVVKKEKKKFAAEFKNFSIEKSAASVQISSKEVLTNSPLTRTFQYKIGDKINGFVIKEVESISEFQLTAVKLLHEATGGEYLHIDKDDSNNTFSVMFRTTPTDSTGLPHILEHTTLCGSEKFPCRDPFFKMLNRSLATYMNASTASDYTKYYFSTQNLKDFENLMFVYLDAVFKPILKESDFSQEGWRLEHENPEDPNSPIIFKGVVFNEMKGVFADNQNLFEYALMNNILPSHTYGVCSGGDPFVIPSLKYTDLKNFHQNYYSPANTKYYSYGNFALENHLKFINEKYLEKFNLNTNNKISTIVPPEKRWSQPVKKHIKCRVDPFIPDKSKQSSIAISVLCCSITDVEECFVLKVLSELLVSGPNSAFYKTLIEPNIGAGFSPATGFESQTRDTIFTVGLQGVSDNDFSKIIQLYEKTIDDVIQKGFDQNHLEAILHTIELNLKHQTSNFGLGLLFSISPIWNHDGNVIKYLKIEEQIEKLKLNLAKDPKYLQKIVEKYFKNNQHKLILTMSVDPNYTEEEKKREEELLKEKIKNLTKEDKLIIFENGLKLLEEQKKDDKSCLPTLKLEDLKKEIERTEVLKKTVDGINVFVFPQPTNGITYFRGLLTLGDLSDELKSFLPLFALVATKMGTKKHDFKEFNQLATLKTGGLNVATHFKNDSRKINCIEESLLIGSHCLNKNLEGMFDLWLEIFQDMKLEDIQRFKTIVNAHAANLVNGITHMGHHYAVFSAAALVSPTSRLKEKASGLTYVNFMKKLVRTDLSEVLCKMEEIRNAVMNRTRLQCAINTVKGTEENVMKHITKFIQNVPGEVGNPDAMKELSMDEACTKNFLFALPIPVTYTAKAVLSVPYEHPDYSALEVMTRLVTMKYLHPIIREKGGAYGAGLNLSPGLLSFYSYRDPNPSNSQAVYDNVLSWLKLGEFTKEDVDEAKLGIFQSIDAPITPGNRGMQWFLQGLTEESVQQHRLRTMQVTKDRLIEVGMQYLGASNKNPVGRVIIGSKDSLTQNVDRDWEVIVEQ